MRNVLARPKVIAVSSVLVLAVAFVAGSSPALSASGRGAPHGSRAVRAAYTFYPDGLAALSPEAGGAIDPKETARRLRSHGKSELPVGLELSQIEPTIATLDATTVIRYSLEYQGVALAQGSDYVGVVDPRGRLLSSRLRNIPSSVDGAVATVDAATATDVAVSAPASSSAGSGSTASASVPQLQIWVDGTGLGRLTWMVTVTVRPEAGSTDAVGGLTDVTHFWVSALGDPVVVWRETGIHYESTVTVEGMIWPESPNQPTALVPFPGIAVQGFAEGPQMTDDRGQVVLPSAVPGLLLVSDLSSGANPFAKVRSAAPPIAMQRSLVLASGPNAMTYDAVGEFQLAQTTAFFWTTFANRFVRRVLPFLNDAGSPLDSIAVFVNVNDQCNAFSTGAEIHFFRSGAVCNNTAFSDIIVHEFGHSVHFAVGNGVFDGAYSEGFGDALSAVVTGQPCMGRGFFIGSDTCLRDLTEISTWPTTSTEVHVIGQVYAEYVWALVGAIGIDATTELLLGAAAASPSDIPDAVFLTFVLDDDDGRLPTCSLHQRAMEAAADSRSLPRPADCRDKTGGGGSGGATPATPATPGSGGPATPAQPAVPPTRRS